MTHSIKIKASAAKTFAKINKPERQCIFDMIESLKENPFRGTLLKGDLTGLRRVRAGNYRVVYEIKKDELVILVIRIGHRSDI
jgi:mRNA interferase RelE/StbE